MVEIIDAILVGTKLLNTAKNLWQLTFASTDDPAKEKNYRIKTTNYNKNVSAKHYCLTVEGNRIISIEPLD
ncbi:hypothetical protein ES703_74785 [subsurface metagenome]